MTFSLVRWPGFTVGAIASTSVEGLIVFLTATITVAIFFGCFALSDILLSDPQKKWIEDRILRLWLWLAEAKQYSILDWLRQYYRWIVGIAVKDATDKAARTPRSRGRSVVVLYIAARTHLSVNKDAPSPRTVHAVGRILPTPFLGGLNHLYVRV